MKKNILISITVLILSSALVTFVGCGRDEAVVSLYEEPFLQEPQTDDHDEPDGRESPDEITDDKDSGSVTVYVCGAVNSPGVYMLDPGARVIDAIDKACGLTGDADQCYVNLATLLEDGQKIYVPTHEETQGMTDIPGMDAGGGLTGDTPGKVNINSADAAALMTLPGIGEAKAALIIEYRNANGRFDSIEDIMKISGIKEGMFNRIKDRICI